MDVSETEHRRKVRWCETPTVKTYVSAHQYEFCWRHLIATPIEPSFINSPVFKAAEFMLGDRIDTMQLLVMVTNYLHEKLGRYPTGNELYGLLFEQGLTDEVIVQDFLNLLIQKDIHESESS